MQATFLTSRCYCAAARSVLLRDESTRPAEGRLSLAAAQAIQPCCHFPKSTSVTCIEISRFSLPHPTAILLKVVCNIRHFAKVDRNSARQHRIISAQAPLQSIE
jgi:hypothetical protein